MIVGLLVSNGRGIPTEHKENFLLNDSSARSCRRTYWRTHHRHRYKKKQTTLCCPPVVGQSNKGRQDTQEDVFNSCETHLRLRVRVLKFHVLVKFSFGQQIEQHQVTDHRRLEDVQGHFSVCTHRSREAINCYCWSLQDVPLRRCPLQSRWPSAWG